MAGTIAYSNDYYMEMLEPLPKAQKLELISLLVDSIKRKSKPKGKSALAMLKSFEGEWGGDTPIDEYVDNLRSNIPPRDISW
ncbi:MAG: hypothetical protein LUD17_01760 [Bacteroidales bacterium]|nr:hypothetical protein [Bacteroidales bacterium]